MSCCTKLNAIMQCTAQSHTMPQTDTASHNLSFSDKQPHTQHTVLAGSSRDSEETAIAIISQLVHRLHDCQEDDINSRLLNKLTEGNGEKLERCAELCAKYAKALLAAEQQIALTAQALEVRMYVCKNVFVYQCIRLCVRVYVCTHIRLYVLMCVCVCMLLCTITAPLDIIVHAHVLIH